MNFARARHVADIIALRRVREFLGKIPLEVSRFPSGEVIPATDDVGPVSVGIRVQVGKKGKHLRGVAAATENNEETGGAAALTRKGPGRMYGGEDVEEPELGYSQRRVLLGMNRLRGLTKRVLKRRTRKAKMKDRDNMLVTWALN